MLNKMHPALVFAKVAELADALDSGSSSRKAVGVQVPPFALQFIIVLFIAVGVYACSDPVVPFIDEQAFHLDSLAGILAAHPADTEAVCADLDRYLADNQKRLMDARLMRKRLMDPMTAEQKAAFARKSAERLEPIRSRIMTRMKTFSDPAKIMHRARQLFL